MYVFKEETPTHIVHYISSIKHGTQYQCWDAKHYEMKIINFTRLVLRACVAFHTLYLDTERVSIDGAGEKSCRCISMR